jgi:hypothetical protein
MRCLIERVIECLLGSLVLDLIHTSLETTLIPFVESIRRIYVLVTAFTSALEDILVLRCVELRVSANMRHTFKILRRPMRYWIDTW